MTTTVKATYANGVLTPTEPLDIEEGREVTVSIDDAPTAGGGLAAIALRVKELHKSMPPDARDGLPADLAMNKKHYLYGHPKEEDA
ncbi:antitoxin family protein [Candidatus Poriferisocius sp.]|uniref:antitoxin family protein n=1 Tax=Candidatus Poriferisocius sp. TaxID=3101276 RepID=UPI003B01C50C